MFPEICLGYGYWLVPTSFKVGVDDQRLEHLLLLIINQYSTHHRKANLILPNPKAPHPNLKPLGRIVLQLKLILKLILISGDVQIPEGAFREDLLHHYSRVDVARNTVATQTLRTVLV